jgi:hypothetical protein
MSFFDFFIPTQKFRQIRTTINQRVSAQICNRNTKLNRFETFTTLQVENNLNKLKPLKESSKRLQKYFP